MGFQTQAPVEIEKLINKGKEKNIIANLFYNLMTNLNQPFLDLLDMPVPLALELLKILDKENKEMEKQMKRRK